MKRIRIFVIFLIITSFSPLAAETSNWETYEIIDKLLNLSGPGTPEIHGNFVIFTAESSLRRVGISFAHENFARVYWYRQLLIPRESIDMIVPKGETPPDPLIDSGIQFHVYEVPSHVMELEYRLIINGLWTTDPINPESRRDPVSSLSMSILRLPPRPVRPHPLNGQPEGLSFTYRGPPGETITVAGNFNGWDPFMYELREGPRGTYTLTIPLPSGTYQYVFFHRGRRFTDPFNPVRIYGRDGSAASEVVIP